MWSYESSKAQLNKLLSNHTLGGFKPAVIELCSASIGACAASLIRVPQEKVKQPLAEGARLPLVLRFEKAGEVKVELKVETDGPAAKDSGHSHH